MGARPDVTSLVELPAGSHVCWVVDDDDSYREAAAAVLRTAAARGEKPIVFGPEGSHARAQLAELAAIDADPRVDFLGGGRLDPPAMFRMFREQTAVARAEGYPRLVLVADMDWLLPSRPTTADVVGFELLLDRHVAELDATIVCAYRRASFDTDAIGGALCVHPVEVGAADPPPFRMVAADAWSWRVAGEVDSGVSSTFEAALAAAVGTAPADIDVSELSFIDVAGMRAIAEASTGAATKIRLVGAPRMMRRSWELAGFARMAPAVELVG